MRKFLTIAICVGMMATLFVGVAGAGLNAAATARLYFLSAGSAAGTALAARNSVNANGAIGLVAVKGMVSARGADVQLVVAALDGTGYPLCWQLGAWTHKPGGWRSTATTTTIFPPLLSTLRSGGAVPGVIAVKDGSVIEFETAFAPNHVGVIWYSAAGSAGRTRLVTDEYGVFGFIMLPDDGSVDPASVPCQPVCISPNWRIGAGGHDNFNMMQVSDANNATDFVTFESLYKNLVYGDGNMFAGCPEVTTPATAKTWGSVKRLYR